MTAIDQKCAALAAEMLDAELALVVRRLNGAKPNSFQRAAIAEAKRRNLTILTMDPPEERSAE
jgi:hypothetical protein